MRRNGTSAARATEIGTIGLVVSAALFAAGVTFGEHYWAETGARVIGTLAFALGAGGLLVALGCVLYLADVAAIVVASRMRQRS